MIPFNKPFMTGRELDNIREAHELGHLSGDGRFTKMVHKQLEDYTGSKKALLTHSCTGALEMAAILAGISIGDEVIMPSYTFVSTANAFVLRGAVPVFVDIRPDTLNIDETKIEAAVTSKTRAIVPVHYAGVACEMDAIMEIANKYNLLVIEDAAQAIFATYKGKPLGSIGHLGCISFHETKNIHSGEGGALLINDEKLEARAEVIREKGTNRSRFIRGQVDKYTWEDVGSSYLPSELNAAFLQAQLSQGPEITRQRLEVWDTYDSAFRGANLKAIGLPVRARENIDYAHNGHIYYLILRDEAERADLIASLSDLGIKLVFHYVPLHTSPAGLRFGRAHGELPITEDLASRLVRLPLYPELGDSQGVVIEAILEWADSRPTFI